MAGKFEISQDKAGKYRFRLKAGNGEIIAHSRGLRDQGQRQEWHRVRQEERPDATDVDLCDSSS